MHTQHLKKVGGVAFVLVLLVLLFNWLKAPSPSVGSGEKRLAIQGTHEVRRGEYLNLIADRYTVQRATMLYVNESYLQTQYDRICGDLSRKYRDNPRRSGTFCNDRFRKPYGNTLVPGMFLNIPMAEAPPQINAVVTKVVGKRVALVIDESGSMDNDRATVASFYSAALQDQGKELIGIWLYADGEVRKIDPEGFVNISPHGAVENTFEALKKADEDDPDSIILITDEPGDDWPMGWSWGRPMFLPPVVATCLPDGGRYACEDNLQRLAGKTSGQYVPY